MLKRISLFVLLFSCMQSLFAQEFKNNVRITGGKLTVDGGIYALDTSIYIIDDDAGGDTLKLRIAGNQMIIECLTCTGTTITPLLTALGIITSGTWQGTRIDTAYLKSLSTILKKPGTDSLFYYRGDGVPVFAYKDSVGSGSGSSPTGPDGSLQRRVGANYVGSNYLLYDTAAGTYGVLQLVGNFAIYDETSSGTVMNFDDNGAGSTIFTVGNAGLGNYSYLLYSDITRSLYNDIDSVNYTYMIGSGNRMVIATPTGRLSTQAIPSGGAPDTTNLGPAGIVTNHRLNNTDSINGTYISTAVGATDQILSSDGVGYFFIDYKQYKYATGSAVLKIWDDGTADITTVYDEFADGYTITDNNDGTYTINATVGSPFVDGSTFVQFTASYQNQRTVLTYRWMSETQIEVLVWDTESQTNVDDYMGNSQNAILMTIIVLP